jgi:sugar phosphate isomerase/epimerase
LSIPDPADAAVWHYPCAFAAAADNAPPLPPPLSVPTARIKSAVTLSLTAEARGGPFVFWDDLDVTLDLIAELGFDGVELFLPGPDGPYMQLAARLAGRGLAVAGVGTGAGWILHRLTLTDAEPSRRAQAFDFVRAMIDLAAGWNAPAIVGSMQGRCGPDRGRAAVLGQLGDSLGELAAHAAGRGQVLLYEPLNRYETDLVHRQAEAAAWLRSVGAPNARLLCDLFHMNIEEADLAGALRAAGPLVGHVHFADSNRCAMGFGHTSGAAAMAALREIGFGGYCSAEILPLPDSAAAARQAIAIFRQLFPGAAVSQRIG